MSARPVQCTLARVRQPQPLSGARYRDMARAALLLQLFVVVHRARGRENALLHAYDKYVFEFQTLGAMHGHERYRAIVVIAPIHVGDERHVFQIVVQRTLRVLL